MNVREFVFLASVFSFAPGVAAAQDSVAAKLGEYRTQIDRIDQQLVDLLNKRAVVVQQIGHIKKDAGMAVAAPTREQQVLTRVVEAGKGGPLPSTTLQRIYQTILLEMRTWESTENSKN